MRCAIFSAGLCEVTSTLCYSCTLIRSVHEEHDHYQGDLGCGDPFDDTDIPQVQCDAECGVSRVSFRFVFVVMGKNLQLLGFGSVRVLGSVRFCSSVTKVGVTRGGN